MNYIILLWEDMKQLCSYLGIEDSDANAAYQATQRMQVGDSFYYRRNRENVYLCTTQVFLRAERFAEDERDIFVKKVEKISETEFYKEFPFLQKMPGEWSLITKSEWYRRKNHYENYGIGEHKISLFEEPDLYSYMDDWRMLDQYNDKILKDMEQKKAKSRSSFVVSRQDGMELTLLLENYPYYYEKNMHVEIQNTNDKEERYRGIVTKVIEPDSLKVELQEEVAVNEVAFSKKNYQISISNQGMITNFNRQKRAMEKLFQKRSVNPNMGEFLLKEQKETKRKKIDREEVLTYLERFDENDVQKEAFIQALETEDIYLIQGPPGTGKTTVITELVNYMTAHGRTVLLSSCSHVAVDNVLERVDKKDNILPIRLGKEEDISPEIRNYMLSSCTKELQKKILYKLEQQKIYEEEEETFVRKLKEERRSEIETLEKQIREKKEKYGLSHYSEDELSYIKEYLKWNPACRSLYHQLEEKKEEVEQFRKKYDKCQQEYQEISMEQSLLEKQCQIIFHQELREQKRNELQKLKRKKAELEKKLEQPDFVKAETEFRKLLEQYNRILSDVQHTREILQRKKKDPKEPLSVYVHHIQGGAREIQNLMRKKRRQEKSEGAFIKKEKELFLHRKELLQRTEELRRQWQEKVPFLKEQIEDMYMEMANVVGATCNGIASFENQMFGERAYDYVIVDEAAHCNTLDLLIPLTMGKKVILVGDQKQLYPMLPSLDDAYSGQAAEIGENGEERNNRAIKEEMQKLREICKNTLFKQLYEERLPKESKIMLEVQYRMTPQIGSYISKEFYDGRLCNGIEKRLGEPDFLPSSLVWLNMEGTRETPGKNRKSCKNELAATTILHFLHKLDGTLWEEKTVGIICYYRLQADEITLLLKKQRFRYLKVECDTIDAFQGKEKDIIIIDLVRTHTYTRFIDDANRLNVAVSRAREMVVMAASVSYVKKNQYEYLERLYYYVKERGGLVDGSIYRI